MVEIIGLPLRTFLIRLGGAIVTAVLSLIIFLYVPQFLYSRLPSVAGTTGIDSGYFIYYAVFITALSAVSTIYRDHLLGDAAAIANGLTQIYYIYIITNGGLLSLAVSTGVTVSIDFSTLLYLLITPSAIGVISSLIRIVSRNAAKPLIEREEIILR
jgi:hypothetical protein